MKNPSRIYRWALLVASMVTVIFLVAAAYRENFSQQWIEVQRDYRNILQSKATDDRGRELLAKFNTELKQVSLPGLGAVDRCVTCHNGIDDPRMSDVANPHRVHPQKILKNHPVDRFGCTVCHHGQGPATNFRDAKADDVFWDYPLLPKEFTQASCATCHDPSKLPAEDVPLLVTGIQLYDQKSCGSCHKLNGRGGTIGPALGNEGAKTRHQLIMTNLKPPHVTWKWHEAHFRDPGGLVADSQMRNPTVTQEEAQALTVYMLSLVQRDIPESYLAADKIEQKYNALHPKPLTGEQVYGRYCAACHGTGTYGRWDKKFNRFVPAIRSAALAAVASREYLQANVESGRPGTQMPGWGRHAGGLLPEEIDAVLTYLRGGAPEPRLNAKAITGDLERGKTLFYRNCAGCHGASGRGGVAPEIGNPVFQKAASDAFILQTIRSGRMNTAMPAFQRADAPSLSDQDLADLVAFVRYLGKQDQARVAHAAAGAQPTGGQQ